MSKKAAKLDELGKKHKVRRAAPRTLRALRSLSGSAPLRRLTRPCSRASAQSQVRKLAEIEQQVRPPAEPPPPAGPRPPTPAAPRALPGGV